MADISLQIKVSQTQEDVTLGTASPTGGAGCIEVRINQTANAVTDASYPGGRAVKRSEVVLALVTLLERLQKDDVSALFSS